MSRSRLWHADHRSKNNRELHGTRAVDGRDHLECCNANGGSSTVQNQQILPFAQAMYLLARPDNWHNIPLDKWERGEKRNERRALRAFGLPMLC